MSNGANSKTGVVNPLGLATSMAFVYILLFIALMLVPDKILSIDGVVLPALSIFLVISGIKYLLGKKEKDIPQWLVGGSFILSSALAVAMTVIL